MVLKGNFPTKILTNMNEPYHRTTIVTPAWDIICVKKEEIKNIFDNIGLQFLLKAGKSRILFDKMESQSIILLWVKKSKIFSSDKEPETEETH